MRPSERTEAIKEAVIEEIIKPVVAEEWLKNTPCYLVNPTGRFVVGGPKAIAA